MNGALRLLEQPAAAPAVAAPPWQVLVVDDDEDVHGVTQLMLQAYRLDGRPVELLHAHSADEGKALLARHPGIALVLLDVVMETEHAGLDLARYIRQQLGNRAIRIVLRTGQPGQAPAQQVVTDYDIDDYLPKAELRYQRLHIVVTTTLRTFSLLRQLEAQRRELERVNAELARHAYSDALTGLMNRRRFEQALEQEWQRAQRLKLPVSALMIDVDLFKPYNDRHGHPAGDRVLQQIAAVLAQLTQAGGSVCRYGGEEFLALLPGADAPAALRQAEQLRARVAALGIVHEDSPHGVVTVSVGCAHAPPPGVGAADASGLIQAADAALYRAKHGGRNRVAAQDDDEAGLPGRDAG